MSSIPDMSNKPTFFTRDSQDKETFPYFSTTPVEDWGLEGFLLSGRSVDEFVTLLKEISKLKRFDVGIRTFALSLIKFYKGELGETQIEKSHVYSESMLASSSSSKTMLSQPDPIQSASLQRTRKRRAFQEDPITKARRRHERFKEFLPGRFWRLTSGREVEQVDFAASLKDDAIPQIRSYTLDKDCPKAKKLFSPKEWEEIWKGDPFELPKLPQEVLEYMSADLSENFWARKTWPMLFELLEDIEKIFMLDGEKMGLDSSRRKNQGRGLGSNLSVERKRIGKKLDLVGRDVVAKLGWFIVGRMKTWDPQSSKFLKELGYHLFKEQTTILLNRLDETASDDIREKANLFGVYTGDR
ncbi:hypothetical protein BGX29_002762, partial [Mortierella sp. GBA35]